MIICRYIGDNGPEYGFIDAEKVFHLERDVFDQIIIDPARTTPMTRPELVGELEDITLLAPVQPGKIVAVGRNYRAHAAELGNEVPPEPLLFLKPPSSIIGPGQPIQLLPEMGRVDHEAELAVVIGRGGRFIPEMEALDHVFGFTAANDVSERDYQKSDGQWTRAKGFDTFCPLGPVIDTLGDPANIGVVCQVNGETRQEASTRDMVYSVPQLIAHISRIMTLEQGDVILTGTPEGVSPIKPGDVVEVSIGGVGTLTNPVELLNA